MSETATPRGTFVWHDLLTYDEAKAVAFYTRLLGWQTERVNLGENQYTVFAKGETMIAGTMPLPAEPTVPPHWLVQISVTDLEETKRLAVELGGRVIVTAVEVLGIGRFAVLADPDGALFAVHQSTGKKEYRPAPTGPGYFCWYEVATHHPTEAKNFYRQLFNWGHKELPEAAAGETYTVFSQAGNDVAGMMNIPADAPYPAHWLAYIESADLEADVARAESLGGTILLPITENPNNMGSFAVLQDPTGGVFALWRKG